MDAYPICQFTPKWNCSIQGGAGTYGKLLVAHHHQQSQPCTYQSYQKLGQHRITEMCIFPALPIHPQASSDNVRGGIEGRRDFEIQTTVSAYPLSMTSAATSSVEDEMCQRYSRR